MVVVVAEEAVGEWYLDGQVCRGEAVAEEAERMLVTLQVTSVDAPAVSYTHLRAHET